MARRTIRRFSLSGKSLLAAVSLLAYLAGVIGVPLPPRLLGGKGGPLSLAVCGCPAEQKAERSCCCAGSSGSAPRSCCAGNKHKAAPARVVWTARLGQWRCQGLQVSPTGAPPTLPPPPPPSWRPPAPSSVWLRLGGAVPFRLVLPLPEPPPRSFLG